MSNANQVPVKMDSSVTWMILFGLPLLAIGAIIAFARYHASEVQQDGRDDDPKAE
ncbi:hypothetical protein [Allosalinactinospora lopnorensis]|uniref:hypothetical protein n=1 Tax=Allosalinactinospora lopnorensis TaxID=1352348 RepID=UPI0012E126C2|nr:hypothetical protein [Allosalinactinospora lopnorensis]